MTFIPNIFDDELAGLHVDRPEDDEPSAASTGSLADGESCGHRGCTNHVTHPCEGCGRTAGRKSV